LLSRFASVIHDLSDEKNNSAEVYENSDSLNRMGKLPTLYMENATWLPIILP
jgi:hypothetical protein